MTNSDEANHDRPTLLPPDQMPPVTSQAELFRTWQALMGELGFSATRLWVLFLGPDGRIAPPLTTIDELDDLPVEAMVDNLMWICHSLAEPAGGSVAFLYSRPGGRARSAPDRCWARELVAGAERIGLRSWPVHLANDQEISVFAPDDLAA